MLFWFKHLQYLALDGRLQPRRTGRGGRRAAALEPIPLRSIGCQCDGPMLRADFYRQIFTLPAGASVERGVEVVVIINAGKQGGSYRLDGASFWLCSSGVIKNGQSGFVEVVGCLTSIPLRGSLSSTIPVIIDA